MHTVSAEEFEAWKSHHVTKALFSYFEREREVVKEEWALSRFNDTHSTEVAMLMNTAGIAKADHLYQLMQIDVHDLNGGGHE